MIEDQLRERAPANRWLGTAEQHEVRGRARHAGGEHLDRRPDDLALAGRRPSATFGGGLEVVELFGSIRAKRVAPSACDERQGLPTRRRRRRFSR